MSHTKRLVLLIAAIFYAFSLASAQQADAPGLTVAEHSELGEYIADAEGKSLYVNLEDADGIGCPKSCQSYWPPFLSEHDLEVGSGVDETLVATQQDEDGQWHASYGGWPLYYSRQDTKAGVIRGQGVGGVWFLVSPEGNPLLPPEEEADEETAEAPAAQDGQVAAEDLGPAFSGAMEEGAQVFSRHCAACHGSEGQGAIGIRLIENKVLADERSIAGAIIRGQGYMPALGGQLTDAELADVLTFVRNSWGNAFGPVTEEVIKEVRAE